MDLQERIRIAAAHTHRSPSEAQRTAGNYRKGSFWWRGREVSIETPKGAIRSGVSRGGQKWAVQMPCHYGYIRRTVSAADGDAVDVMMGPHPESDLVCVVDQQSPGGRFDEHKAVLGCLSVQEAKELYLRCYSAGWQGLRSITPMTRQQFFRWLEMGDTGKPIEGQVSKYGRVEIAAAHYDMQSEMPSTTLYAKPATPAQGQQEFRWITIHPHGHEEGTGTPVKIDGQGRIVGGPKGIADKGICKLSDFGKGKGKENGTDKASENTGNGHELAEEDQRRTDAARERLKNVDVEFKEAGPDAEKPGELPTYTARGNEIFDSNGVRHASFRNAEKAKSAADEWNKNGKPGQQAASPSSELSSRVETAASKVRQSGLFSQSDLGGAPQLFDTGKEFVKEKKGSPSPVKDVAPSKLEQIEDELKGKAEGSRPLAGQKSLLGGGIKRGRETDSTPTHDELNKALSQVRQTSPGKWWSGTNPVAFPTKWQAAEHAIHNVRAVNAREAGAVGDYPVWNGNFRDIANESELRKMFPPEEHERVLRDPAKMSNVISSVNKKNKSEGGWSEADRVPDHLQAGTKAKKESKRDSQGRVIHPTTGQVQSRGEVSEVDGIHYPKGQWMPVHGLTQKQESKPKSEKPQASSQAGKANENAKARESRVMSPQDIAAEKERRDHQAKWDGFRSSKLGQMLHVGERLHHIKNTIPFKDWYEYAESVPDSHLRQIADKAKELAADQAMASEGFPKDSPERQQYIQHNAEYFENSNVDYMTKKHVKARPASVKAHFWLAEAMRHGDQSEVIHQLADLLTPEPEKFSRIQFAIARSTHYARETRPTPTPKSRDAHQPEPTPKLSASNGGKKSGKGGWITLGGSHVHVGSDGKIMHGCPGLKGERVQDLKNEPKESRHVREVRQDHAEARGLTGHDVTASEARKLANADNIRQHAAAKEAAKGSGHSTASVLRAMPGAHELHAQDQQLFRPALNYLQKVTGATPAKVRDWVEVHDKDWTSWPDFDIWSRTTATDHPELNLDPYELDTPQKLWDLLLSEGKRTKAIESHAPAVARTAVQMLGAPPARSGRKKKGDSFEMDGDTSFDPDKFSRTGRVDQTECVDRVALAAARASRFALPRPLNL